MIAPSAPSRRIGSGRSVVRGACKRPVRRILLVMTAPPVSLANQALVEARQGDPEALWAAADELRPYLRAVAARILKGRLGHKVDASDVVQQALLASFERFEQFRGEDANEWQRWLVTIVRNEAKNLLRYWHQERRQAAAETPVMGSRVENRFERSGATVRLRGPGTSPSRAVAARQEAAELLEALDRLPREQREILTLRHFEGLSHPEIAQRLGKSPAAVRQAWVRALKALKNRMGR